MMRQNLKRVGVKNPTILASATFSPDMAENLLTMCRQSAEAGENGQITVEIRSWGVWGVTAGGRRVFLGSMEVLPDDARTSRPRH